LPPTYSLVGVLDSCLATGRQLPTFVFLQETKLGNEYMFITFFMPKQAIIQSIRYKKEATQIFQKLRKQIIHLSEEIEQSFEEKGAEKDLDF